MTSRNTIISGIFALGLLASVPIPTASAATGIDWSLTTNNPASPVPKCGVRQIVFGKGLFVAVCRSATASNTGESLLMYSYGREWVTSATAGTPAAGSNAIGAFQGFTGASYGAGRFLALTGLDSWYSDDGISWTKRSAFSGARVAAYGNGKFVAVGYPSDANSATAGSSTDGGLTWTQVAAGTVPAGTWKYIAFGKANGTGAGTWVAAADTTGSGKLMSSTDGVTWTDRTESWMGNMGGVTYGNGQFVAVCLNFCGSTAVYTSPDGVSWTARTAASRTYGSVSLGYGFGVNGRTSSSGLMYVAVGRSNLADNVLTSPDGVTWTTLNPGLGSGRKWVASAFGNGTFMALNNDFSVTATNDVEGMYSGSACGDGVPFTKPASGWAWMQYATPCSPAGSGTIASTLGTAPTSNLAISDYNSRWRVFDRNANNNANASTALPTSANLSAGVGYWLGLNSLLPAGQPVDNKIVVSGGTMPTLTKPEGCRSLYGCVVLEVKSTTAGTKMLGNPFGTVIDWADVRIRVGGEGGTTYTPDEALGATVLDNQIWYWTGLGYDTVNTTSNPGNLKYSQSFFVKVLSSGVGQRIDLIIPASTSTITTGSLFRSLGSKLAGISSAVGSAIGDLVSTPAHAASASGWKVSLRVQRPTGTSRTTAVLGQYPGSQVEYDANDLDALAPSFNPYLTVVFPRPTWTAKPGDYSGDFRPANGLPAQWPLEIRAGTTGGTVVLKWEGDKGILKRSRLVDSVTGATIDPSSPQYANGYSFTMTSTVRRMTWSYLGD